jgi:hypothetical protein
MTSSLVEALFSSLGGSDDKSDEAGPSHSLEGCLAALHDRAQRSIAPCLFEPGDMVTVLPGSDVKGAGQPHVVVEVFAAPFIDQRAESGSNQFLRRFTMRVAHFQGDVMTEHAVDHGGFERWTDDHATAWNVASVAEKTKSTAGKAHAGMGLMEVVRILRGESKRLGDAKITWKKGELVEILGHDASNAAKPMAFEGRSVGLVERVDTSDDTTRVIYFDDDGDRRTQWFRPVDLKPYTLEPVGV